VIKTWTIGGTEYRYDTESNLLEKTVDGTYYRFESSEQLPKYVAVPLNAAIKLCESAKGIFK
jgi:hypothetical protein